jgi:uncharacterized protein (DUF2062 family)
MLFRRRKPADFSERIRAIFWPRRSFFRSLQYLVKRTLRLHATPHAIAAGIAAGVFVSFTPFLGFHFILAAIVAYLIGGNVVASAFGTAIGNPLTFPFIWATTFEAGRFLLTGSFSGHFKQMNVGAMLRHADFADLWGPLLKPMTIGAIPVGLAFALGFYFLTRLTAWEFRERRRALLAEKARKRAARDAKSAGLKGGAAVGQ